MVDMDRLTAAAKNLRAARWALTNAMEHARQAALDALANGGSEAGVARALDVNRMTVRKWMGKR